MPGGSVELSLSNDAASTSPAGMVFANTPVRFFFDATANLSGTCQVWSNAELLPQTQYLVNFFDADGSRLNKNEIIWQFTQASGATVDIGTMIPITSGLISSVLTGGVLSVGLTLPSTLFTVSGTPVTTFGNLSATLNTQPAKTILAAPIAGPDAAPTFRALQISDLPISGTITHAGMLPIGQPDGSLAFADPLIQGLQAEGSSTTGLNPVLIGGKDLNGLLRDVLVDTTGRLEVTAPAATTPARGSIKNVKTAVKGASGFIFGWYIFNPNTVPVYVQIFDLALGSVTVGTTAPTMSFGIPPQSGANSSLVQGIQFSNAISIAMTTGVADNGAPALNVDYNFFII